jgi:aspartyl-tRNA synthetase
LCDLSALFADSGFNAFKGKGVAGLVVPGKGEMGRNQLDGLTDRAKSLGASGLVWMRVRDGSALEAPVVKFLSELEQDGLRTALSPSPGDLVLIVADPSLRRAQSLLGTLRVELGAPERLDGPLAFTWVVEFPLFETISPVGPDGTGGKPIPAHHPFTRPHPDDLGQLESDPLAVRSLAYDLVLNGIELGSGSVRIHDSALQSHIFTLLGIDLDVAQERFGFLLDAFRFGAPPHAGFAVGLDRLTMILTGESSIREVIAFPKTQSGSDPLTGAPASVDHIQLRDLGISLPKPK